MMETETISINKLIPSEYNPRIMSKTESLKLARNLERFGLVDPIIINLKNNHIIGGHQRYNILQEKYDENYQLHLLRLGDIGWVFEDTELTISDENHEKALNLSLNRLDGEFDPNILDNLLSGLYEENFDMELTGFDDYEILEYTLDDDYDITLFEEMEDNDNNEIITHDETSSININFYNNNQRQQFIDFITRLKEENKEEKTITQLIIQYMQKHSQKTSNEKIYPYTILFESQKEQETFNKLYKKLEKQYQKDPILLLLDEK